MDLIDKIIKDLSQVCFCSECGKEMGCYSHFCESCKERVVQPIEGDLFAVYIAKKYKN